MADAFGRGALGIRRRPAEQVRVENSDCRYLPSRENSILYLAIFIFTTLIR